MSNYSAVKYILVGFVVISVSTVWGAKARCAESPQQLETAYKNAYKLENMRLYQQANNAYEKVNTTFFNMYDKSTDRKSLAPYMPVVLSSIFRLTVTVAKDNFFNMHKLIDQLESFDTVNEHINRLMTIMIEMNSINENLVWRNAYAQLFFARAYNNTALAYKLLQGIIWKNYIVYPPEDIIGMVRFAMIDLDQMLLFENLPYQTYADMLKTKEVPYQGEAKVDDVFNAIQQSISDRITNIAIDALVPALATGNAKSEPSAMQNPEFRTRVLMSYTNNTEILSRITSKRCYYQGFRVLHYYYTPETQDILNQKYTTVDDILQKKNKTLFGVLSQLVEMMGIK